VHGRPLTLLGCGYTLGRLARAEARAGRRVVGTTRDPERARALGGAGVEVLPLEEALARAGGTGVVVSIPPEAGLDARIAARLAEVKPAALVYLSSTGVYGGARGHVDEDTPVDPAAPSGQGRLAAEALYRPQGGVALRVAGIYGPGRGLHQRLLAGTHALPDGGHNRISRIHVDDLGAAIQVALERGGAGSVLCVADDAPVPQREVVAWLCERLGVPLPPSVPAGEVAATLRGDRAVSNARLKALGWTPRYPTYREGFSAALEEERAGR
jgi:nucleoside-diphosphate-sugar epimerase